MDNNDPELRKKLLEDDDEDVENQELLKTTSAVADVGATNSSGYWFSTLLGGAAGLIFLGPIGMVLGAVLGFLLGRPGCVCCCKFFLVCLVIFAAIVAIACYAAYGFVEDAVEDFTVTTPHAKFPTVDMTDHELELVKYRVNVFVDSILAEKPPKEPLVITQDEINGLICHLDYFRGNYMVTLNQGKIKEEYSLPMDSFPGGDGRYFVGSDYVTIDEGNNTVEVEMETAATHEDWFVGPIVFGQLEYLVSFDKESEKAMLEMFLKKGSIFGQEASKSFIDMHQNLLQAFYEDDNNKEARTVLEGIDRVSIQDGKIVVEPRATLN
mmetsp:Transcript_132512/g.187078  ORF Transcript_132512/g.187078 Transcript_132512/m.187078 type:complete len:324 (-) Transcript_132512:104-1075(-)